MESVTQRCPCVLLPYALSGILHLLRISAGAGEPFSKGIAKPMAPQPDEPVVLTAVENTQSIHNVVVCTLCSHVPTHLLHLLPLATSQIIFVGLMYNCRHATLSAGLRVLARVLEFLQVLPNKASGHLPTLVPQPQLSCPCGALPTSLLIKFWNTQA